MCIPFIGTAFTVLHLMIQSPFDLMSLTGYGTWSFAERVSTAQGLVDLRVKTHALTYSHLRCRNSIRGL